MKTFVAALRLSGVVCVTALLAACQPSLEEVVAEHRPAVETVFRQLQALETAAFAAPPVVEDRIDTGGKPVVLEGDASNALFVAAADLRAPESATADGTGATRAGTLEACGEALRGDFPGVAKGAALFLAECGRAEYAFVLRTHDDTPARLVGDDSFDAGRYEGDVLLFRLADGALLGGFRVSAESSDQVSVRTDASGNALDAIERLNSDLSAEVFMAIENQLRAQVPGVIPP